MLVLVPVICVGVGPRLVAGKGNVADDDAAPGSKMAPGQPIQQAELGLQVELVQDIGGDDTIKASIEFCWPIPHQVRPDEMGLGHLCPGFA